MPGTLIFAGWAKDEAPNDPALCIERLLLHALPNLLDGFDDIAFLELSESPMHVSVVAMSVILFGLTADVQRLLVDHMNVEEEGQIIVGIGVLLVK